MKPCIALVTMLFASACFSLLAQQPTAAAQAGSPAAQPATRQNPQAAEPVPQNSSATSPDASAAPMSPVDGELVSKLDSKTAKAGDDVVVRTKAPVRTADGTEVPKGSKLVGHVVAVQASGEGANSQVALQFDHVELKSGQSLAVHSQIQSIAPAVGAASASGPTAGPGAVSEPPTSGANRSSNQGSNQGSNSPTPNGANGGNSAGGDRGAAPAGNGAPAAGTVVAKSGNIAIQTTSIPGVLLANNAPGQQDPRMARASSILLGAKRDIQLDSGTQVVVAVSAAGGGAQ
jgi:hypothetical protein